MRLLDAVALAKLDGLRLGGRALPAEGAAVGRHKSPRKGYSRDFAQHRPYAPGDEVKALDWKVYARQDRYYVREYRAESLLTVHILADASGSMGFAEGGREMKWERARRLVAALAYLALAQGDAAGLTLFDEIPRRTLPPRAALSQLELIDAALWRRAPGGETGLAGAIDSCAARLKRRSLVVLVSDLLGDAEAVAGAVRRLKARHHAVLVLQVLDPQERDFMYEGPAVFEGLEGGPPVSCDATVLRAAYRAEFDRRQRLYERAFHGCEAPYGIFYTDRPWDEGLARLLSRLA